MKRLIFFILSAALHGAALFMIGVTHEESQQESEIRFEVDLVTAEKNIAASPGETAERISPVDKKQIRKRSKKLTKQLTNNLFPSFFKTIEPPPGNVLGGGKSQARTAQEQFDAMGLKEAAELLPFFMSLWDRVNSHLEYPQAFVDRGVTGVVNLSVEIDHQGMWTGRVQRLSAQHDFLKTYVLAIISQSLNSPQRIRRLERKTFWVRMSFDFSTYSLQGQIHREKGANLKNSFLFKRAAYREPAINRKITEVFTRYVPPIIPIPGGFYIDFFRAYQFVKNWGEPSLADQQKNQASLLNEKIKGMVRSFDTVSN